MPYLSHSNKDIEFPELEKLTWRSYTLAEVLPITSWEEFIDKKDFAKATLNKNLETFVMHIAILEVISISVHLYRAI